MGFSGLPTTFAAVDIGSHTLRMIIAALEGNALTPVRLERRITRLARHFSPAGCLDAASIEASMSVLSEYRELARRFGVERIACGATGVVRRASNGEAFLARVRQTLGFPACILSEADEALHSARGVLSVLDRKSWPLLTFDLGGSTTEFLLMDGRTEGSVWSTSVMVGAATLTEAWIHGDPPDEACVRRARVAARETLLPALKEARSLVDPSKPRGGLQLVGTAGTVTTLAAMHLGMAHYEPVRVNGLVLTDHWLQRVIDRLGSASLAERREMAGLEAGREDIILAGALIVHEILIGLGQQELTVTDAGLLEGLLIDLIERTRGWRGGMETALRWRFDRCS